MIKHLPLTLLFATATTAQTYIVDATLGPGAHYDSLVTAVADVPSGSVLVVRPGIYPGFTMAQKAITVLGEPGALIQGTIVISATAANQTVTMRQLGWVSSPTSAPSLQLTQCQGDVVLDRVNRLPMLCGGGLCLQAMAAVDCAGIVMQGCVFHDTIHLQNCRATLIGCDVWGRPNGSQSPPRAAIEMPGSTVQLCHCLVRGGSGGNVANGHGVDSIDGDLRVLDCTITGGAAYGWAGSAFGGTQTGSVRVSPSTQLMSFGPTTTGVAMQTFAMPRITATSASPGGSIGATLLGPASIAALLVGLPAPPTTLPGFSDPFSVDPNAFYVLALGGLTGTGLVGTFAVPNQPDLVGSRLVWHGVTIDPTATQATNPAVSLVLQ